MATNSRMIAQAQTRKELKRAARELMLKDGYTATSIASIASRAGYTTGAVYSNFGTKAELALEVLRELQSEARSEISALLSGSSGGSTPSEHIEQWALAALDSGWPRIELEFALASRGDTALIDTEGDRNRSAVADLSQLLERVAPEQVLAVIPAYRLAELLLDLVLGLAVRKVIAPDVRPTHVFDVLADLRRVFGNAPG